MQKNEESIHSSLGRRIDLTGVLFKFVFLSFLFCLSFFESLEYIFKYDLTLLSGASISPFLLSVVT